MTAAILGTKAGIQKSEKKGRSRVLLIGKVTGKFHFVMWRL